MEKESTSLPPDWVRCQSKSRPNRYYLFNKKTGETNWCLNSEKTIPQQTVSAKDFKTPAQDRLKRLQSSLQKKKISGLAVENPKVLAKKVEIPQLKRNVLTSIEKQGISTQSSNEKELLKMNQSLPTSINSKAATLIKNKRRIVKPMANNKTLKKKFVNSKKTTSSIASSSEKISISNEIGKLPVQRIKATPNTLQTTKGQSSTNPVLSDSGSTNLGKPLPVQLSLSRDDKNNCTTKTSKSNSISTDRLLESVQYKINDNEKTLEEEPRTGFVSKLKNFCSKLMNRAVIPKKRTHTEKNYKERQTILSSKSKLPFKPTKKLDTTSVLRSVLQENENGSIQKQLPSLSRKTLSTSLNITSDIPVPNESANARLQRLRTSLHLQQTALRSSPNASASSSRLLLLSENSNINSSICSSTVSTSDCEAMDWQSIAEESVDNKTISVFSPSNVRLDSSVRSEHYETVNENLMRLAAETKQNKKWKRDHFYIIVDTNVFLQNITFIDELTSMKLCDTSGTLIYVPYCVLQELDKLKIRSSSESVKTRSARAIKYLNASFEDKLQRVQAQSAVDETQHLIKVTSPDDSILNCCLQVKKNVDNVLLLTEDINLQNKAMCNDVLVSTKSDLISKHESLI